MQTWAQYLQIQIDKELTMKDISFDFSGRKGAVTGGPGVLGADLVRALVERGADVAVMDLNMDAASELCNSLKHG